MKLHTPARIAAVAVLGTLALAACGSDNNTSGSSSSAGGAAPAYCASGTLNASGSTAQANAMTEWIKDYQTACSGATINYNGVGSGQGVTDFTNGQTSFAGSDSALDPTKGEVDKANARCKTGSATNLPMVPGPIAVVYNVKGADNLVFTPQVLAKIFSGKITKWNDPAIKSLNSSATLPAAKITTYHRSDASGYVGQLHQVPARQRRDRLDLRPQQAVAGTGRTGRQGLGRRLRGDQVHAQHHRVRRVVLRHAEQPADGRRSTTVAEPVTLTADSVGKAVAAATVVGTGDDLTLKLDYTTKVAGAYPIILVTYEITCVQGLAADQAKLVKGFLTYTSSTEGQAKLTPLGYAPLPTEIQTKVQGVVAKIS